MNQTQTTFDSKTFAIGVLSVTACVLLIGFLLLATAPKPAYGSGQGDRSGDYIMTTQKLSSSQEGLIIIDAASKKMLLYAYDFNKKQLEILNGFELDRLGGGVQQPQPGVKRP